MAEITKPDLESYGVDSFAPTDTTGTDTLGVKAGTLYVYNTTVADVDLLIDGVDGSTVETPTTGTIDVSGGFTMTCVAGEITKLNLGNIAGYLTGDVAVTGGETGVYAWVL